MHEVEFGKETVEGLLAEGREALSEFLSSLVHPSDIVEFMRMADVEHWPLFLSCITDKEQKALVVSKLDRDEWNALIPLLTNQDILEIIKELETDDAVDLLADVSLETRIYALKSLSRDERAQVQKLLRYPEDTAGGIMQLELAMVQENSTVEDAVKTVRELVEDDVEVLSVWVVDKNNRLVGVVALVDLLLNKSTKQVAEIMDRDFISVKPFVDQEEVAFLFKKYDLITLAVVDEESRLLGRIVFDDVIDVVREEAEEDALQMAGINSEEMLHQGGIISTVRARLPWLGVALCCSLISAALLSFFEPLVKEIVIIVAFLPVITAMGGNVGTQSSTVLIRGFATGKFDLANIPRVLLKELQIGLLMGVIYGVFAGIVATFFLSNQNFYLGLVVFFSMVSSMVIAAFLGVVAPSLLKRMQVDPAIASGPFVTTMNDITGIIIYMLICGAFLTSLLSV